MLPLRSLLPLRPLLLSATSALALTIAPCLSKPVAAAQSVDCWMNQSKQTCKVQPWGNGGFEISFSGSAIYRFVPAGPPTTENRRMRDEQGRIWLMSGHHSFELVEQGGYGNRIAVSNVRSPHAAVAQHQPHSKVKLTGHGQPTVTLYAQPSFGAAIAGMGVSGETLDKLECTTSNNLTWCRVGYPGQRGRVLWAPAGSLVFLGDGE